MSAATIDPAGETRSPKGRDLWLRAGQDLLRAGGVRAIKVRSLADHLGLTTGSFYHHFSGMPDFLEHLASSFAADHRLERLLPGATADPRDRLVHMAELGRLDGSRSLDRAMRDWAMTNRVAAEAVRAHDAAMLTFVARAFEQMGHDVEGARLRAHLLVVTAVARIASTWPDEPGMFELVLAALAG